MARQLQARASGVVIEGDVTSGTYSWTVVEFAGDGVEFGLCVA